MSDIEVKIIYKGLKIDCVAKKDGIYEIDTGVKHNYGETQVIISEECCTDKAKYKVLKTGKCYCAKHFDTETGKPLS